MKTIVSITFFLSVFLFATQAQVGKSVTNVKLVDVNDVAKNIPYLGNKVFTLFYVDPDVQDVADPLSDALDAKKFPKDKFGAIGLVNCKDTWFPNSAILTKARQKQEKFPESLILLDKNYILRNSWGLGDCNDIAMVIVIGKDTKIKYAKAVKSQDESKDILPTVLKIIEEELKK
jgi:predicted transcriptional regulator